MKMVARGWSRNMGDIDLAEFAIKPTNNRSIQLDENMMYRIADYRSHSSYSIDGDYRSILTIENNEEVVSDITPERVVVSCGMKDLALNGNYLFSLSLTRSDIINMFITMFADESLERIIPLLQKGHADWQEAIDGQPSNKPQS